MANRIFHVYILASTTRTDFVKVGRTSNHARIASLLAMEYAGVADWQHKASFPLDSNQTVVALESMINARLTNQGYKRSRISWINQVNQESKFADECYSCTAEHAIAVAYELSGVYQKHVP